jgi:hypothetical protein
MPLRERQEIQEMLRRLTGGPASRLARCPPHTTAYRSAPSELNLRKTARQEGNNRGRLQRRAHTRRNRA